MLAVLFGALLIQLSVVVGDLTPVVFVPGYGGCALLATIESEEYVPAPCRGLVPINQPFQVMYNASLLLKSSACVYSLMTLVFEESTKSFSSAAGIQVTVRNFGGFDGISPVYWSVPRQFKAWGYKLNVNAFAAPYDYRVMSVESLTQNGFVADMQGLVERAFLTGGRKKVALIGHSNGGPTLYTFLKAVPQAWKDKYVASLIGLSGNYLGQMNAVKPFLSLGPALSTILAAMDSENSSEVVQPSASSSEEIEMMGSWESNYMSMPWGGYSPVADIPIVTTYTGDTSRETNYTSKGDDVAALFETLGRQDWVTRSRSIFDKMDRTAHPKVASYCFYGTEVDTSYSFAFSGSVSEGGDVVVREMGGDGNQDILDNTFCQSWENTPEAKTFLTVSRGFPGVHHMQMYRDSAILEALFQLLQG